jgi:hypothetical protein
MAFLRMAAAAFVAACVIGGSVEAQAQPCRKQCDKVYNSCSKAKQADGDACLRKWHSCKRSCTAPLASSAAKAARQTPAPVQQARR